MWLVSSQGSEELSVLTERNEQTHKRTHRCGGWDIHQRAKKRPSHEHCHSYENSQKKVPSAPNHSQEDLGLEKGRKQLGHKDWRRPGPPSRVPNLSPVHTSCKQKASTGFKLTTLQLTTILKTKPNALAFAKSPTGPGPSLSHLSPLFATQQL